MLKIAIVAGGDKTALLKDYDRYVGVDAGCLWLAQSGYPLDLAVGDFDSVSPEAFKSLKVKSKTMLVLPTEKDQTDLEAALDYVLREWGEVVQEIAIYGALGGRIDHAMTNFYLPTKLAIMSKIRLVDAQNQIFYYPKGKHTLHPIAGYDYIGFVQSSLTDFEIKGAKYPLTAEQNWTTIYASNEFLDDVIEVDYQGDYLIVIYSRG